MVDVTLNVSGCWVVVVFCVLQWRQVHGWRQRIFVGSKRSGGTRSFSMINFCEGESTMLANGGQAALLISIGPYFGWTASEKRAAA